LPALYASQVVRPAVSAAATIRRFNSPAPDDLTVDALVAELDAQAKAVNAGDLARGEAMLTAQAHTLDLIFATCAQRAHRNMGEYPNAAELYFRVALRAQSQCRATWETLATMKNPPAVAFVRQANIANGPQQVNNGTPTPSRPREDEITPSKLLEASDGERMDTGTARAASRANQELETVGAIHGAANARRQGKD
jgi:hypothetical protein